MSVFPVRLKSWFSKKEEKNTVLVILKFTKCETCGRIMNNH